MLRVPITVVSSDPLQKDEINKKAFEKFRKEHTSVATSIDNAVPSERFDGEYSCTAASWANDEQAENTRGGKYNRSSVSHKLAPQFVSQVEQ